MSTNRQVHIGQQPSCRAALSALALALWSIVPVFAQAETLEGKLEQGANHSVLWFVSSESGDLIGQVFANTSQVGQVILANCLPGLSCKVEGAIAVEPDEQLVKELHFKDQPSGWWHIRQAQSAHMQANLPISERHLRTRFGQLEISDDRLLMFNGSPVLDKPPQAASVAPQLNAPLSSDAKPNLLARIKTRWDTFWTELRRYFLGLLGRTSEGPPNKTEVRAVSEIELPVVHQAAGTVQVVQGNSALHIVAHFELEDRDIVLLQDTGGTLCPALYRFVTLTTQGIAVTSEFGSCSGITTADLKATHPGGTPEPFVTMSGFLGPFEPQVQRELAFMRLHRFILRQGKVLTLDSDGKAI